MFVLHEETGFSLLGAATNRNLTPTTKEQRQVIKFLLENDLAKPHFADKDEYRYDHDPFTKAVTNNDIPLVKLYLQYKANPNYMTNKVPPLLIAVVSNYPSLAKLLIKQGAKVNQKVDIPEKGKHGILAYLHHELSTFFDLYQTPRHENVDNYKKFSDVEAMVTMLVKAGASTKAQNGNAYKTFREILQETKNTAEFNDVNNHEELSDPTKWMVLLTELSQKKSRELD